MSTLIPMARRMSRSFSSTPAMAVLLLMGFLLSAIHGHAASPDPGTVTIDSVGHFGGECTWDAFESSLSDDGKLLKVKYVPHTLHHGLEYGRKMCTVTFGLSYPAGFRFRLVAVTMSGHAKLDDPVTASIHTSYSTIKDNFNLAPRSGTARCDITGPFDGSFNCMDDFDELGKAPIYGHCNSNTDLTIRTELRSNRQAHIDLTQVFTIAWESC